MSKVATEKFPGAKIETFLITRGCQYSRELKAVITLNVAVCDRIANY